MLDQNSSAPVNVTIIDQGSFAFFEYDALDAPPDGPVISGVQALQILPSSLACRCLHFPEIGHTLQAGNHPWLDLSIDAQEIRFYSKRNQSSIWVSGLLP